MGPCASAVAIGTAQPSRSVFDKMSTETFGRSKFAIGVDNSPVFWPSNLGPQQPSNGRQQVEFCSVSSWLFPNCLLAAWYQAGCFRHGEFKDPSSAKRSLCAALCSHFCETMRRAKLATLVNAHIAYIPRWFDSRHMSLMVATRMFRNIANEELRTAVRELKTKTSTQAYGSRVIK